MSVSRSAPTTRQEQRSPTATRALRLFDDLLFASPEICSHCFRRIRDREEHDATAGRLGTGNRPDETLERAGDGTVGYDADREDQYGRTLTYTARTYCAGCGSPGGTAYGDDDVSLQTARRRGDQIIRRLHEAGHYVDVAAFYSALEHLKTDPSNQGKDREIFATATYLAIDRRDEQAPDLPSLVEPGQMPSTHRVTREAWYPGNGIDVRRRRR